MGLLDAIFNRKKSTGMSFDVEDLALFQKQADKVYMKRLAIEICVSFLARTISQSEFIVKDGKQRLFNEIDYHLNVRPNKNQTASTFWQSFIRKLVYDNEVLVIQADDGDLLIADDYQQKAFAFYGDTFSNILVRDFELKGVYRQDDVLHIKHSNERLEPLINSLFADYGELFRRVLNAQKRKGQIRGTVDMDMIAAKSSEHQVQLQNFINNMYKAIDEKDVAIIPQQKGFEYNEKSGNGIAGQSVDEVNKVTGGFLEQLALALGIPMALLRGDMADVDKQTKNYMFFTVSPILKKIQDETNVKFITKNEYMDGKRIEVRKPAYRDIFDLAVAIDKLVSSGVFNGNEVRSEVGYETTDEEIHNEYFITKNYQTSKEAIEGGEKNE